MRLITLVLAVLLGGFVSVAAAQPMAERVPDDAVIYVGWRGVAEAGEAYEKSHFKGLVDAWDLRAAIQEVVIPLARDEAERNGRNFDEAAVNLALDLWSLAFERPWALYVGPIEIDPEDKTPTQWALVLDAGDQAERLHAKLREAMQKAPEARVNSWRAGSLLLVGGRGLSDAARARLLGTTDGAKAGALAQHARFTATMKQAGPADLVALYVDAKALVGHFDRLIRAENDEETAARFRQLFKAVNIDAVAYTGGFNGADYQSDLFIAGLGDLAEAKLEDRVLQAAPQTAQWARAFRFDLAAGFAWLRRMATEIDADAGSGFEKGLAQVNAALGMDLEKDILAVLGDQWLIYGDQSTPGPWGMGFMLTNFPRDPAKMRATLDKLEAAANKALAESGSPMQVQRSIASGAVVRSIMIPPLFAPAWTLHKDRLLLALSPQSIGTRIAQNNQAGPTLADAPAMQDLLRRLGDVPASSVTFVDVPRTGPAMMEQLSMLVQLGAMGAAQRGQPFPNLMRLMPAMDRLLPHLTPAASVSWIDAAGYHSRSLAPFPGADAFSPSGMVSGGSPAMMGLMAGILLPSLTRAREVANRAVCAANMRSIHQAAYVYAATHRGKYPPDLAVLVKQQSIVPKTLLCPSRSGAGKEHTAPDINDVEAMKQWIDANSPYIYVPGLTADSPPDRVVLYEKLDTHSRGEGINIVFNDGHVEFQNRDEALRSLRASGIKVE